MESPARTPDAKKKRKFEVNNDSARLPKVSPGMSRSTTRLSSNRGSLVVAPKNPQTIQVKKSLYQQGIEMVNSYFFKLRQTDGWNTLSDDGKVLMAAELLRQTMFFKNLYNRPGGVVVAMGQDDTRQLGLFAAGDDPEEELEDMYPPTLCTSINAQQNIVQVAAGGLHSLAITDDGNVYSWGCNDDGALGRETRNAEAQAIPTMIDKGFEDADQGEVVSVTCGDSHTLYLTLRGHVYMSGMYKDVDSGKFCEMKPGETSPEGQKFIPTRIQSFDQPVKSVASGCSFNAALLQDDTIVTWGMGHAGELARSDDMTTATLDTETGKRTYDLGKSFYGQVYVADKLDKHGKPIECFRYLHDVVKEHFLTPRPPRWAGPAMKRTVISVACGSYHLLVAARDPGNMNSVLYTSGLNNYGQLGHGDMDPRHELTPVKALQKSNISQMAAGEHFSMALNSIGNLIYSWGRSDYGQLGRFSAGQPSGSSESIPGVVELPDVDLVDGPVRFNEITAGDRHAIAITQDHDVYTWGFGETGLTGHDLPEDFDANRPQKLDVMRAYRKKKASAGGLEAKVHHAAGGGQHSVMVIKRYNSPNTVY